MTETPDTPSSPFSQRYVKTLKISIGVMTFLIVVGIGALIFGLVRQASRISKEPARVVAGAVYSTTLQIGPGEVKSIVNTDTLIVITWKGEKSDIIVSIDPRTGQEFGRILIPR